MGRRWIGITSAVLLLTLIQAPEASASISSVTPENGAAVHFTGADDQYIKATNPSNINMGNGDFTISWWQKTTSNQNKYPRILQFGEGHAYTDKFAISEENSKDSDGRIHLWINEIDISSMPIPAQQEWHHIAISREGYNYTWFLNGNPVSTTTFVSTIPCDGCLSKFAEFDTTGLDLYLGAGNDTKTGGFIGDLAGFQITPSARWVEGETFTAPTNFLNPIGSFNFSMYASETQLSDKSTQPLAITAVGLSSADFVDFTPPVPPPPDVVQHEVSVNVRDNQGGRLTAYTDSWTNDANNRATSYEFWVIEDEHYEVHIYPDRGYVVDFLLWNGEEVRDSARWNGSLNYFSGDHLSENLNIQIFFRLQTLESMVVSEPGNNHVLFGEDFYLRTRIEKFPNNYWGLDGIVMALPVFTANPGEGPIRNTCFMDLGPFWDPVDTATSIEIALPTYSAFLTYFFPSDCQSPRSDLFPEGIPIPNYHNGIFGSDSATVTLALFSQTPEDITDFSTAVETLTVTLGIPPDILSGSVTSADPSKAESGKIYFGDTFTVTASDVGNASFAETVVFLPEASPSGGNPNETACYLGSDVSSDNSYRFPTESELIARCRLTYTHPWEFNRTAEHNFFFFYPDDAYNHGWPLMLTVAAAVAPEAPAPPVPDPPVPDPPAPTSPAPVPPIPPAPVEDVKVESNETHLTESVKPELEKAEPTKPEPVKEEPTKTEKPKTASIKAKACTAQGIWIFTKSGLLQICDAQLKVALATKACTGKSATPTFPWVFKAQRFKPGYTNTKSGLQIYYSVFFYKGLAIAGIDHVSNAPCSNGSVFIDKKSAKKVYEFLKATNAPIWVKDR